MDILMIQFAEVVVSMDVLINWFIHYNITTGFRTSTDVMGKLFNIPTPRSNLEYVTKYFMDGLKEIYDKMDSDNHLKESIIKNPSVETIKKMLTEQDLGFTFDPMRNDLTIYKDMSLLKESENLSGILSPNLVEIKTDDKEYSEKVMKNLLKKIFSNGYQIITY